MRALDLFCKEGGASVGYARAGFDMTGWDWKTQLRYPFAFRKGDAMEALSDLNYLRTFDLKVASPPCQGHSALAASNPYSYEDFIPQTRAAFIAAGGPYVIENVEGAPLKNPIMLCGSMFGLGSNGYQLRRHRLFESNVQLPQLECRHDDRHIIGVYGGKARCRRRGGSIPSMGTNLPKGWGEEAMGIDWMTIAGLSEAIPPAYTEWIGKQIVAALQ